MKKINPFISLLISSLLLFGCSNNKSYRRARFYMGTTVEFNIVSADRDKSRAEEACDIAESRIAALDGMFSIFDESSMVSKINRDNGKRTVEVVPELFRLTERAGEYFRLTEGAFDITIGPLTELWGFGPETKSTPDAQTVREILHYVGFDKIELDRQKMALIFKDPRVRMDFGGLAKGYAVDEAVKIFRSQNIKDGLINIGGDLYCMGRNPKKEYWSIGINDPQNKNEILAVLQVRDKAIATSGNYENFYIYNERRYAHIIDPLSGYTVSSSITSATIIADDCATADALATAVFVMGERKGLALIEKLSGIECFLVVTGEGGTDIVMSSGMERYLKRDET